MNEGKTRMGAAAVAGAGCWCLRSLDSNCFNISCKALLLLRSAPLFFVESQFFWEARSWKS